jgi:uncharacterized membrane protein SpoIIM required for sporulation/ABC-type transport system involved in multi-copper enzyme maturation permease subunit
MERTEPQTRIESVGSETSFSKNVRLTLAVTQREMRDQLRDWRIIFPIVLLTLIFPWLMNFTAARMLRFVQSYGASPVGLRLAPFLLMIVGFFPISVSLVIALESFVGEKERRSIEPLLCSPLSDAQLYVGKLLASMVPPLLAAYFGIAVYLIGLYRQAGWTPGPQLLVQILMLTMIQAVVMVSGAVVISSQTTSTRAANLLASFIIIPMAFLIQGESVVMFWAQYDILWWSIAGQAIIAGLLIRTGLAYFNREDMLGREMDTLDLRAGWRRFVGSYRGSGGGLLRWYREQVFPAAWSMRLAILVTALSLCMGAWAGVKLSTEFRLPAEALSFGHVRQGFVEGLEGLRFISAQGAGVIFLHNLRTVVIALVLGIFSFGVLAMLTLMLPFALIAYIAASAGLAGHSPLLFLAALVLPHGVAEIPAILLAGGAILSLGATLTAPAEGRTLGDAFVERMGRSMQVLVGLSVPLFLLAAFLEVFVTPRVAVWLLKGW